MYLYIWAQSYRKNPKPATKFSKFLRYIGKKL